MPSSEKCHSFSLPSFRLGILWGCLLYPSHSPLSWISKSDSSSKCQDKNPAFAKMSPSFPQAHLITSISQYRDSLRTSHGAQVKCSVSSSWSAVPPKWQPLGQINLACLAHRIRFGTWTFNRRLRGFVFVFKEGYLYEIAPCFWLNPFHFSGPQFPAFLRWESWTRIVLKPFPTISDYVTASWPSLSKVKN